MSLDFTSPQNRAGYPIKQGINGVQHRRIGIITGSGPEAGIDLWSKVLFWNRNALGERFKGDLESPPVVVYSEPLLGLSMNLRRHDNTVWNCLARTVRAIEPHVDVFTIACNTLHYYAPRVRSMCISADFLDVAEVVHSYITERATNSAALLGAKPVGSLDEWSPYHVLHSEVSFEQAADLESVHDLIHRIKHVGGDNPEIRQSFINILSALRSETIFLACTELPLVNATVPGKLLVDINDLLAKELVARSISEQEQPKET
ncbi:aspartate/glutamate racemase family protein [Fodinicurvata fenggangensis]|uniref:aspartate/glutamate racemase family protein n=1 Tax=Fodinicurvata fenggangensis TaxID=1121830 RepID=UPI0006894A77|nr:aspartate/glutamate racemase family protein [Fodinicurvata fenggangensis]